MALIIIILALSISLIGITIYISCKKKDKISRIILVFNILQFILPFSFYLISLFLFYFDIYIINDRGDAIIMWFVTILFSVIIQTLNIIYLIFNYSKKKSV
jgi:hypothetical protein